jgi:glycosyltransferase involved in cell wall biosynthesis
MTSTQTVDHFGPDPETVGGMATVIRLLRQHSIGGDLVHAHATWTPGSPIATAGLFAASTRELLRLSASSVVHIHLSERGSFLREGSLIALARHRGVATVASIHGASFDSFAQRHRRLVSEVLGRADVITCLDEKTLEVLRRSAPQILPELLPNPAVLEDDVAPADTTDELIVFAGEISVRKGADVLARAWPHVAQRRPSARCLMVGPVTDFEPTPTERLELRPPVGPAEMSRMLRAARVVALPARAEAMPMILTEAMSMGRPFVSTPVGAIPELAAAGGVLVPVNDAAALADSLTNLLSDPDLAKTIGERGRQFCIETRSVEIIDARLRELYKTAVAGRDRRIAERRAGLAPFLRRNE